jgi:hypothetical protein
MDPNCNMIHVRCYSKLGSGLCSLVGSNETKPPKTLILEDPISNACYNDTVDLKSGTDGLYLVPILSPWDENQQPPLGFIQVARSLSVETLTHTIALSSLEEKKKMEDDLTIHLITIFARVLSGLLAHAKAIQLTNDCKDELKQAQIAFLNARLDDLEQEYLEEQEEVQGVAAAIASSSVSQVFLEKNFLQTMEKKKNSTKSFIQKDEKDDQEDAKEEEMDRLAGTPSVNEKKVIEETSHHLDSLSLSVEHDMSFPVIEVSPNDPNDFGTISTMPSTLGMSIGLDDDMLGTLSPNVSRHRNMGVSGSSGVLPSNDSAYVIEFASPMSGDIGSVASSEDLKDVLQ